ncbi:MAG: hypothetical protein RIQ81_71 [Pseudomonadota bacterium]|jgi:hypothetical protein
MRSASQRIILATAVLAGVSLVTVACLKRKSAGKGARMLSLNTTVQRQIPDGSDPARLCAYIQEKGYFPSNSYPAGTKVLYSTSYEIVDDAAGQARGVVAADGTFQQIDNVTTQLLLCPGAVGGIQGGRCLWKINGDDGYAQLAYDVVCNKRSRGGSQIHPGYSTMKAAHVAYQASTAGDTVSGSDAIEVTLQSRDSLARILFAKGTGLVATLFQESSQPAGTAEVFIGAGR